MLRLKPLLTGILLFSCAFTAPLRAQEKAGGTVILDTTGSWRLFQVMRPPVIQTGSGLKKITESVQKEFLTVLVPNSPTPVTGYVIVVPKEQTIALDMTIEEAFRFAVSAGVIAPDSQRVMALPGAEGRPQPT